MSIDPSVHGCTYCASTAGRAGCPTHRDSSASDCAPAPSVHGCTYCASTAGRAGCPAHRDSSANDRAPAPSDALRELRRLHNFAHTLASWESCEACGTIRAALTAQPEETA